MLIFALLVSYVVVSIRALRPNYQVSTGSWSLLRPKRAEHSVWARKVPKMKTPSTYASVEDREKGKDHVVEPLLNVKYRMNQILGTENIEAVNVRHIAVATESLAQEVRAMLVAQQSNNFETLASSLSLCETTKYNGGECGWITNNRKDGDEVSKIVPPELLNEACYMNKGDIITTSSIGENGVTWHVMQLMDVETKLTPALNKRKKEQFIAKRRRDISEKSERLLDDLDSSSYNSLTYFLDTMGCQMNVADSERMEGCLQNVGYSRVEDSTHANVVILNTCSIRDHAEQKVYSYLGQHAVRKRKGEDVSIVVAGCVAQQEGDRLIRRFPEIDVVMGPQYAGRMTDLLESAFDGNQVVATGPAHQTEDSTVAVRRSDLSAFVNVIYGCNERCTYCVVPTTRGVEQSRTKEAIIAEMEELAANGCREVTLLGQNIDSWGRDFSPKAKFADLLAATGRVLGIERVRFLTSHPKYMSKRVITAVADNPQVLMPCFNVPYQAGDDKVLKNMRRGYTRARFLDITRLIREQVPDAEIVVDVIVGFPGETEEQFQKTLDVMKEVKFAQVNTAAYSPRPNTPAADWGEQLSEEVKQDRLQRINRLGTQHALERSERFVGRNMEVLVEDVNVKNPELVYGRIPHSRLTYFKGNIRELRGKIVTVRITEAMPYHLIGELVNPLQSR